jgi:hypothetical protein
METKFNFKSQICTSVEQSRRLLKLGLKKETADMHRYYTGEIFGWQCSCKSYKEAFDFPFCNEDLHNILPAWSLHRLIEIVAHTQYPYYVISKELPIYDALCERIEWLIKEGYFNKEYLVNQDKIDEHCKGVLEYLDYIRGEEE